MAKGNRPSVKPVSDASRGYVAPAYGSDMTYKTLGSSGLRQYGGWVREEFLPALAGRQAQRVYREMQDNSPTVGAILFAILQTMREVTFRVEPPDSSPESAAAVEFVESCMEDMTTPWPDFVSESLSMLPYGFAPHEIVYKRRNGKQNTDANLQTPRAYSSRYDDGKIGWAKLPLRGQDTITKWFFDDEGNTTGLTQQPYFGGLIDIPIQKLLLFRPRAHKGNPEGNSILRTSYRPWWFLKRLEEQEAICLERMSGVPVIQVPSTLLEAAQAGDPKALSALTAYKLIVTRGKVDEQMGVVLPSDTYLTSDGAPSNVMQYKLEYVTPQQGRVGANFDVPINRYKLDIMTSVLADFLVLGHGQSSRGSQTLGEAKIDLFMQATEGWLDSNSGVLNDRGLTRLWKLNGFDEATQPRIVPDMPRRIDLDGLSNFILRLSQSGAALFPDPELENYLRDAADLPELSEDTLQGIDDPEGNPDATAELQKRIAGMLGRRMIRKGFFSVRSGKHKPAAASA